MAKQVTLDAVFNPNCAFLVSAHKSASLTGVYDIEIRPKGDTSATWIPISVGSVSGGLQTTTKIVVINGSPGYDYRVHLASGTADDGIYWDEITTLQSIYHK